MLLLLVVVVVPAETDNFQLMGNWSRLTANRFYSASKRKTETYIKLKKTYFFVTELRVLRGRRVQNSNFRVKLSCL